MIEPGRKFVQGVKKYRYGFNGKENDNEVKGEGCQQDYGMRIYDERLGRFLSVDPLTPKYPELTPYQFAENCPIKFIDLDGAESFDPVHILKSNEIRFGYTTYQNIEDKVSFTAGSYNLHKATSTDGQPFYIARFIFTNGRYKGMYQDDWGIGVEAVNKFIGDAKEYGNRAAIANFGLNMGGSGDLSAGGMVDAGQKTWTPQNVINGVVILGGGIVATAEARASARPTWQESEQNAMKTNPGYQEQVSFKNGVEVPSLSRGSVRPEGYRLGESIEVKNYKIITKGGQDRLVNNVVKQARKRIANLPKGTHQNIIIEMKGNHFKKPGGAFKAFREIKRRIETQAGSQNVTVFFQLTRA